jgi:hypothetical protein
MTLLKFNFLWRVSRNLPKHQKTDHGSNWTALHGLSINKNNGIYNGWYEFDVEKKLGVEASYQRFKEANGGL